MIFENVKPEEKEIVLGIYRDSIGQDGCTWSESYPSITEYEGDMSRGDLYCAKSDDGEIMGVVSIDLDEPVEALECWSEELKPGREISRLGVRKEFQNQGLGGILLGSAMKTLKERGYKSAHFLVSGTNERALRAYKKIGCKLVGECFLYEHEWLCYEKDLSEL